MGYAESSGWCRTCQARSLLRRRTPNHILHLLLSIVTAGLWLIVWLLLSMSNPDWLCARCGTPWKSSLHGFLVGVLVLMVVGVGAYAAWTIYRG